MKKLRSIISLLMIIMLVFGLCACAVTLPEPLEMSSADEAAAMGFSKGNFKSELSVGEYAFFDVKIKYDYAYLVQWTSSNPSVAKVDSNGRVDALSEGEAVITASAKKASVDFQVKITKAKAVALSNTTAIFSGKSTLEQNILSEDERNLYALLVNPKEGWINAYTYNSNGTYNVPVRAMVCSAGSAIVEKNYWIESRQEWSSDDKYSYHYATYCGGLRISSAPYKNESPDTLVANEYNKLGTLCTDGNLWLAASDAKWIYDNCNDTTLIKVSNTGEAYIGIPKSISLGENSKSKAWDPTDPDGKNPYKNLTPYFEGIDDMVVSLGTTFNPLQGVKAFDTCSNEVSGKINVEGSVVRDKVGTYIITYLYTDALGRTGRADRTIRVVTPEEFKEMNS